jgi:hypothetical protein
VLSTFDNLADAAKDAKQLIKVVGAFSAVAPILSVVSLFLGKDETDTTQALINTQFRELNTRLDALSVTIDSGFASVNQAFDSLAFDELIGRLTAIRLTSNNYFASRDDGTSTTSAALRKKYAVEFS